MVFIYLSLFMKRDRGYYGLSNEENKMFYSLKKRMRNE